jgi:hypothetical protein
MAEILEGVIFFAELGCKKTYKKDKNVWKMKFLCIFAIWYADV